MQRRKSPKQLRSERIRRRADIRRGVKIGLYEANQALAPLGLRLDASPAAIQYTVVLAEAHRRDATPQDVFAGLLWDGAIRAGLVRL